MQTNNRRTSFTRAERGNALDGLSRPISRGTTVERFSYRDTFLQSTANVPAKQAEESAVPTIPIVSSAPNEPIARPDRNEPDVEIENLQFPLSVYEAPHRPKGLVRRRRSLRRHALRITSVALVLFVLTGGLVAWKGYGRMNNVFHGDTTVAALSTEHINPELLKGEGDGRVNILLLGIGGDGHDGADLTDTIMVLSVDPVNHKAAMLSIPRDLWVKMPVKYLADYQKINAAYSSGKSVFQKQNGSANQPSAIDAGFNSIDQAVETVLGIQIDYHVLLDFKAFSGAVDTVDGVSVDVKEALTDPSIAWENGNSPLIAAQGRQTFDGKKALLYVRSRKTTSDFARSERQRQVLVALKNKVVTLGTLSNPAKLAALMNTFSKNMYSDLTPRAATRLYSIVSQVGNENITSLSLTEAPNKLLASQMQEGVSVVLPVAGPTNYADIQDYVRSNLYDGYLKKENAPIYVLATTTERLSSSVNMLQNYGYNITGSSQQVVPGGETTLLDLSGGTSPYTKHHLENRYGVAKNTQIPQGITVPVGTKFVIMIAK